MADFFKTQGNQQLTAGDAVGAIQSYGKAIALDDANHILYSNRSAAYLKNNQPEEALKDALKCIQLDEKFVKGYSRLGASYIALGRMEESISAYAKGLSLEPTNVGLQQSLQEAVKGKSSGGGPAKSENGATTNGAETGKSSSSSSSSASTTTPPSNVVIGIDLGTTYSCVGVWENGGVTIIPDGEGRRTTPSVVFYHPETGERRIGHDAKRQMTSNPGCAIYDAKRLIGQRYDDVQVQKDVGRLAYKVRPNPETNKPEIVVPKGPPSLSPEEVGAFVLSEMKKIAENYLKRPVTRAVVTVPAYFSDAQRQATKDAGAIAGLNVLRVINEPTAAALAYGLDAKSLNDTAETTKKSSVPLDRKILVFDLGGGTFDVSILTIEGGVFEVMATGGDTHLGGEDFDNNTADFFAREIKTKFGVDGASDPKIKSRLKSLAEQAKIALSSNATTSVPLDSLGLDGKSFEFTRAKFEKLNEEPFNRCFETVKKVVKDAKIKMEQVADVVLVGGSTRIPLIRERLRDMFGGKQLCQSINPDEAVAYGAAVQGAILSGTALEQTSQLILVDVTPLSLGIECTGRVFSAVIPRNTPLPTTRKKVYTTEEDYQTAIDVRVFEGERQCVDGNNLLGEFTITGLERAKRGVPQVEVEFAVSVDGILRVTAKDLVTNATGNVAIAANSGRLSESQIAKMLADAEKYRRADEARAERVETWNELESVVSELSTTIEGGGAKLPKKVKEKLASVKEWMEAREGTVERERVTVSEIRGKIAELTGLSSQ